jgi:glycosyltransferase involved in cell wall biosynthesis
MSQSEPLISVVVPVYKVEKYIHECINSVLGQTYKNFELILVDDGSPDTCGEICDDYSRKDTRVRVIHKKNGGLSDARNAGIDIAKGEYITFIDSDDYVHQDYLKVMLRLAEEHHASIVQVDFTNQADNLGQGASERISLFNPEEALTDMLRMRKVQVIACAKLYRTDLFKAVRYPYGRLNEDNLTTYKLILACRNMVAVSPEKLYYYRVNDTGIMNGSFSARRYEILSFAGEMRQYMGAQASKYDADIEYSEMRIAIRLYNECIRRKQDANMKAQQNRVYEMLCAFDISSLQCGAKYYVLLHLIHWNRNLYDFVVKHI